MFYVFMILFWAK